MIKVGYHTTEGKVLYTEHLEQIPTNCPETLCCDDVPETLQALMWIQEGGSSGNPPSIPPTLECDQITLTKDEDPQPSGAYCWRGDSTSSTWNGCLTPDDFEVVFCCDNAQQTTNEKDCTLAHTVTVEGLVGFRDEGCCCEPMCWSGGVVLTDGTLFPVDPGGNCGVGTAEDVEMRIWIRDNTDSEHTCEPREMPDVGPCPSNTDDLVTCGEFGEVDADEVQPAIAKAIARTVDALIASEGSDLLPCEAKAIARTVTAEIANASVTANLEECVAKAIANRVDAVVISEDCCDDIPDTMTAELWLEEEPPGGGGAVCLKTESITLTKESGHPAGTSVWSGTVTFLTWVGCVVPPTFSVRFECVGTGTSCSSLFVAKINGRVMTRHSCSCTGGGAISTSASSLSSLGFTVPDPPSGSQPCGLIDLTGSTPAMGVYIYSSGASTSVPPNACGVS
jgi:hypothetical protein